MSYLLAVTITGPVDNSLFDGIETEFTALLTHSPDLVLGDVGLYHGGVGELHRRTEAGDPVSGEFKLSGTDNRDVKFGQAPDEGDQVYETLIVAS